MNNVVAAEAKQYECDLFKAVAHLLDKVAPREWEATALRIVENEKKRLAAQSTVTTALPQPPPLVLPPSPSTSIAAQEAQAHPPSPPSYAAAISMAAGPSGKDEQKSGKDEQKSGKEEQKSEARGGFLPQPIQEEFRRLMETGEEINPRHLLLGLNLSAACVERVDPSQIKPEHSGQIIRAMERVESFIRPIFKAQHPEMRSVAAVLAASSSSAIKPESASRNSSGKKRPMPLNDTDITKAYCREEKMDLDFAIFKVAEAKARRGTVTFTGSVADINAGLKPDALLNDITAGINRMNTNQLFDEIHKQIRGLKRFNHETLIIYARIGSLIAAFVRHFDTDPEMKAEAKADGANKNVVARVLEATGISETNQRATMRWAELVSNYQWLLCIDLPWHKIRDHYGLLSRAVDAVESGRPLKNDLASELARRLIL